MKTALFALFILSLSLPAMAGDYFPYRPKRLTYEFASPFTDPVEPKLPPAKLTITTRPDSDGHYPWRLGLADLASIEAELGKQRLIVPQQLLRRVGPVDLTTLDFFWVGERYWIALSRKSAGAAGRLERVEFVFRDGHLVDFLIEHQSQPIAP